jgi:hypothetical protein
MAENTRQMRRDLSASSLAIIFLVGCWLCALGGFPLLSPSFSAKPGILAANILFVSVGLLIVSVCLVNFVRRLRAMAKTMQIRWRRATLGFFSIKFGLSLVTIDLWRHYLVYLRRYLVYVHLGELEKIAVKVSDYKFLGVIAIAAGIAVLVFLCRRK